ncbi:unnamed protein product [Colias eurytheme]|nr:unnamed protein product [Colias eurytheme]
MSFNNKTVLVTGASSGIGAAIAIKFAEEGADVAIIGRNEGKLKNVLDKCRKYGRDPLIVVADLTNDSDTRRVINEVIKHYGKLNILVNNAGTVSFASILSENAMNVFDQTMAINLRASVFLTHLSLPHLIESRGNVVNISSIGACQTLFPYNFTYCASKAALDHFMRSIAMELGGKGVRVNNVNPGPVKTEYFENSFQNEKERTSTYEMLTKAAALGKISEASEIADLVLYLASDKARSITGSSFVIDNGVMLNGVISKEINTTI